MTTASATTIGRRTRGGASAWRGALAALAIGLASSLAAPAWSQEASGTKPRVGTPAAKAWLVNCSSSATSDDLICQMSQQLTASQTGQRLMSVVIRRGEGKALSMLVALPHGLYIPAGIKLTVDGGKALPSEIQTSDANGVYAALEVTDDLLRRLKAGNKMEVSMTNVQRNTLAIPVSLAGFTAAVTKLQSFD